MRFLAALIPALLNGFKTLLGKILAAFGITVVSYVGLDVLFNQFKEHITSSLSTVPTGMLQLFYLAGGGTVLNIFFGCMTFILSYKTLSKVIARGKD